jgi:hypothetical protein
MGRLSEREDAWQAEATANAVADARSIAQSQMAHTPAGRLSDQQWGWAIGAAIFAWIRTRYQQAVAEGLAQEQHVTRMDPSPCEKVRSFSRSCRSWPISSRSTGRSRWRSGRERRWPALSGWHGA